MVWTNSKNSFNNTKAVHGSFGHNLKLHTFLWSVNFFPFFFREHLLVYSFFFILLNYVEKQMLIITFKFKALIYHCIHFDFFYANANHVVGLFSTENSTFTRIFVQWKDKKFHQYNFTFDVNKNSSKNILKIKKSELLLECQKKTLSKPSNFFAISQQFFLKFQNNLKHF